MDYIFANPSDENLENQTKDFLKFKEEGINFVLCMQRWPIFKENFAHIVPIRNQKILKLSLISLS